MGRRGRSQGLTGVVLRTAQRVLSEREREAGELAQAVYVRAVEWEKVAGPLPLAAVATAAETWAAGTARRLGLDAGDEELVADVAAYLTAAWLEILVTTSPEDFRRWQNLAGALEAAGNAVPDAVD